ncbi:MAG: hypothetical protein AAB675_03995 [Patescibacteria group bacterium]
MNREKGKSFKFPRLALAATSVFGLTLAGCAEAKNESTPDENVTPTAERSIQDGRFLDLPFPPNQNMQIQQAWAGFNPTHYAMDIIKGDLDSSITWETFPVTAGADGKACANPPSRQGNAVLIEHNFEGEIVYEYSGHLKSIKPEIPPCAGVDRKEVKMHEVLGQAGSTGVVDDEGNPRDDWEHLHWALFKLNNGIRENIDPFDRYGTRDIYPNVNDPKYTNGLHCGPDTILIDCPTLSEVSQGNKTPEATFNNWREYASRNYGFKWEIPRDWEQTESVFIGSSVIIENFRHSEFVKMSASVFALDTNGQAISLSSQAQNTIEDTFEKGFVINPNESVRMDNNPQGISEISGIKVDGNPIITLYFYTDEYRADTRDIEILFVSDEELFDIKFSYSGELSKEETQRVHEVIMHLLSTFKRTN